MNIRAILKPLGRGAAIMAIGALLPSCKDDSDVFEMADENDIVSIQATVVDTWISPDHARSQGDASSSCADVSPSPEKITRAYKMEAKGSPGPLYVFESVSDHFHTPAADQAPPHSRGQVLTQSNFINQDMGVYCFSSTRADDPPYMRNIRYRHAGAHNRWEPVDGDYRWPASYAKDNPLDFVAYLPYNPDDSGKEGIPRIEFDKNGANPLLRYRVADGIDNQPDLLVAHAGQVGGFSETGIRLDFHHALTSVRFISKPGSMYPGTVTNVTLRNIAREGVYDILNERWVETSDIDDFSFDCNVSIGEKDGDNLDRPSHTTNPLIGSDLFRLMMLPQNSASRDAPRPQVVITFTDYATGVERVFSKELDIDWQPGKSICYYISSTDMETVYTFDVAVKGGALVENGIAGPVIEPQGREIYVSGNIGIDPVNQPELTVTSYYTVYQYDHDGSVLTMGKSPAQWETEMEIWNASDKTFVGEKDIPSWFKDTFAKLHGSGKPDTDPMVSVIPIEVGPVSTHRVESDEIAILRNNVLDYETDDNGKEKPYDLSTCGGRVPRSTANCYVISAPGHYAIPLIYGNAYKDGQPNVEAYEYRGTRTDNMLRHFLRHDNQPITSPWICENIDAKGDNLIPQSASQVRFESIMGAENHSDDSGESQVRNYRISDDKRFLIFDVGLNNIKYLYPSNSVLAVTDENGTILWHWHLWITGLDTQRTSLLGSYPHPVMDHTLGQLPPGHTIYDPRVFHLKITQVYTTDTRGDSRIVRFSQNGDTSEDFPQLLYYQFGRMDPVYAHYYKKKANELGVPEINDYYRVFRTAYFNNTHKTTPEIDFTPAASIGEVIRTPLKYFNTNGAIHTTEYRNLWNNGTAASPIKTVYDPCPPGYMVPPSALWDKGEDNLSFDLGTYTFDYNSVTFPRGMAYLTQSNGWAPNYRYTFFWTGDFGSDGKLHTFSFYFNETDKHVLLNTPKTPHRGTHTSYRPSYMAAIRPIKEP